MQKKIDDELSGEDLSVEQLWQSMGVEDIANLENMKNAYPEGDEQAKILLLHSLAGIYKSHGQEVTRVTKEISEKLGLSYEIPTQESIAPGIGVEGIEYDDKNNPTISLVLDGNIIDELVGSSAGKVVNMSFEIGRFGVKYQMNEFTNKNEDTEGMIAHKKNIRIYMIRLMSNKLFL